MPLTSDYNIDGKVDWDSWLSDFRKNLEQLGYREFNQNHKLEDFSYWKSFYVNNILAYQIAIFFYDFRKYSAKDESANRIGISFDCVLHRNIDRIDLCVSKDFDVPEFELLASKFHQLVSSHLNE